MRRQAGHEFAESLRLTPRNPEAHVLAQRICRGKSQQRAGNTRLRVIVPLLILVACGGLIYTSMPSSRLLQSCGCTVIKPPGPLLRPFFSWGPEHSTEIDCSNLPVTTADIRAALPDFQSYPRLELRLYGTKVTDDGLQHLAALHHLRMLWIDE